MSFTQNNYFFMDVNANIRNVRCLNCSEILHSKFCPNCGQSIKTHRFSLKLFFKEVFINGVFQIDKGFFYTFKELFIRPGHSIRAYVDGSRVNHFNYFTFIYSFFTKYINLKKKKKNAFFGLLIFILKLIFTKEVIIKFVGKKKNRVLKTSISNQTKKEINDVRKINELGSI